MVEKQSLETNTINIHADLIERCCHQDEMAQYELYKLYSKAMLNTAFRICGNREDAEDALQEAFVSAFKNIKSYRADATFGAWLKRIVINKSLTVLRKNAGLMNMADSDEVDLPEEESLPLAYDVNLIREKILELPQGFRTVLTLYLFEGYDHEEIGQILGVSESTSKTQYKRAKEKLKTMLLNSVHYG